MSALNMYSMGEAAAILRNFTDIGAPPLRELINSGVLPTVKQRGITYIHRKIS